MFDFQGGKVPRTLCGVRLCSQTSNILDILKVLVKSILKTLTGLLRQVKGFFHFWHLTAIAEVG